MDMRARFEAQLGTHAVRAKPRKRVEVSEAVLAIYVTEVMKEHNPGLYRAVHSACRRHLKNKTPRV